MLGYRAQDEGRFSSRNLSEAVCRLLGSLRSSGFLLAAESLSCAHTGVSWPQQGLVTAVSVGSAQKERPPRSREDMPLLL